MKGCWTCLFALTIAACGVDNAQTSQTTQEIVDCNGSGNFPAATLPVLHPWNNSPPPTPGPGGSYVVAQLSTGDWIAAHVDVPSKTVPWAVTVPTSDLGKILAMMAQRGIVDIPRPNPPRPNPGGDPPGTARWLLEYALRTQPAWIQGLNASAAIPSWI